MKMRFLVALCLFAGLADAASADWSVMEIGDNLADADRPALAVSPDNVAQVAWEEEGVGVWTQAFDALVGDEIATFPQVFQGAGRQPVATWTWRGFLLVWIDGQNLKVRFGDGLGWGDPPLTLPTGLDLAEAELDLQGCAEPGWNVGWLVFTLPDDATTDHWFVRLHKGGYDPPELLAAGLQEGGAAQVSQVPHVLQPVPRAYYFPEFTRLSYRTGLYEGGWEPAATLPYEWYGAAFDVRAHADGRQALLSLGPQPVCPCNTIHYSEQDEAGAWGAPITLMTIHDHYDWPHSPRVAWGGADEVHAFWVQFTYNQEMEPGRVHLEYRHRADGLWLDEGDFLETYERRSLGRRVALDVTAQGAPLFAWTRKDTIMSVPQPRRVWLARPQSTVGAPALGGGGLELTAWPNPGHARIALSGSSPQGVAATLAVYDLAGRRLASPSMSADGTGRFAAAWDGRDAAGRDAPAGVYLMRLTAAGGTVTRRVVLAR